MEISNPEQNDLHKLKDLKDYKVAKRNPDVREWSVFSRDKKHIGRVDEIIVDLELMKAVYLDVYLLDSIKIKDGSRHLLIEVDAIDFDVKQKSVQVTNIKTVTFLKKLVPGNGFTKKREVKNQNIADSRKKQEDKTNNNSFVNEMQDERKFNDLKVKRLSKLKDHDVIPENPDIRGWPVLTSDNIIIGRIDDLLIDDEFNSPQYLDIKVDEGPIFDRERHVLIPVRLADISDAGEGMIRLKTDVNEFVNFPPYKGEPISEYQSSLIYSLKNKGGEFI